jgi:cell wall-associated NlpC family hydrolase
VFNNVGIPFPSGTYTAQGVYDACVPISASEAKAGDLIFFTGTYDNGRTVTHVGIYAGNGSMLHSGSPVKYSNINTPYWQQHFYSFGRYGVNSD